MHKLIVSSVKVKSSFRTFSSQTTQRIAPPKENVDWDSMGFSLTPTDFMYVSTTKQGDVFKKGEIKPYGPLSLYPSAGVLNYGQGIFEGLKAFRTSKDRCVVFRPKDNSKRFNDGADRFLMSKVPEDVFLYAIDEIVKANSHWIPPSGRGALYLRPLLFGSGAQLGVAPSKEYTFTIYASPVGRYFKGKLKGIDLLVTDVHRAAPRGSGSVKAIGNYVPAFQTQKGAKEQGYSEVLFLDAKEDKYVEEAGASNFFVVGKDEKLYTAELNSILAGVTRSSIIQLAKDRGMKVVEGKISIEQVLDAKETFCSGTGASVTPVASITYKGNKVVYGNGEVGKITQEFYNTILDIQNERIPDKHNWLYYPYGDK